MIKYKNKYYFAFVLFQFFSYKNKFLKYNPLSTTTQRNDEKARGYI